MNKLAFLFCLLLPFFLNAQQLILSGVITDIQNGEELPGATVYVEELKTGTVSDLYGNYSLSLEKGRYRIRFSYMGYNTNGVTIEVNDSRTMHISLSPSAQQLKAVEISAQRRDENVKSTEVGLIKMNVAEMKTVPVLFGENDILKTLTLMPGVATAGDGNTGLYVRGGGPDQNLILMDGAPVYNASHLLGFFSVFNSDALSDLKLYKGGIPSNYGGRISSVLDVKLKDGNPKEFVTSGGLGLISSRLTLEGPLIKDKTSFIVSGRRTYADKFLFLSNEDRIKNSTLYFYDLNFKISHTISPKDKIYFSGYHGRDVFNYNKLMAFDWGNTTGSVRWQHIFNDKLVTNTSAVYSNYDYKFKIDIDNTDVTLSSGIKDYQVRSDWDYYANTDNTIKFGVNTIMHNFKMPSFSSSNPEVEDLLVPSRVAYESGAYIQQEKKFSERISLNYGMRFSLFKLTGPGEVYTFDEEVERVIDTTSYTSETIYKTYAGIEPRLSMVYLLNESSSLKASYNRGFQYLHLLSNSSSGSPTDLWIPVSNVVQPQMGDQVSAGYFKNFLNDMFETSVEVYYKKMQNIVDYKNGANIIYNPTIETELLYGKGWAYGAEFFVKKSLGDFTGWVSYTIARSMRQIEGINNNNPYPQRYDRTHDLNILLSYNVSPKWNFSTTWVFATGNPVTFPIGKYEYQARVINYYSERNAHRLPPYHRMDLSATYEPQKQNKKFHSSWNFSIFNVYARENPFMINFRESAIAPGRQEAVQVSLFRMVPSVTWNFKF
jgi:hypothetical protein